MFKNKVVLIVGAGASKELGFPLGQELKQGLAKALDIKFKDFQQTSGDKLIVETLRDIVRADSSPDINPYLVEGWAIRDGMPTTTSIDSFLHTHNSNKKLVLMGKLAIARCLLVAERKSPLYRKDVHVPLDLTPVEGTWYAEFFKLLSDQVAEPECIFRNLAIISFNYDRSLEYYLLHALMRRFLIAKEKAEQIMKSLSIYHPYGAVGPLPWEVTGSAIHYGGEEYHGELLRSSEGLRTFSEGVEEGFAGKIREEIKAATTILLIGFGYAPINMDLLRVTGDLVPKPVYATAFDIHPTEKDTLRRSLGAALGVMTSSIGLHFGTTGADLFRSCRISFAAL